jgi:hypothetical protein
MKTLLSVLVLILSLVPTETVCAEGSAGVTQPTPGSALRKAVLDGLRPSIEADIKQKVIFIVDDMRVSDDWAFVRVTPIQTDSKPIDFRKTKYKEQMEEGMFDGATTYALLRKKDDQWVVLTFQIGPTDVCWDGWDGPPYNCPRKILLYGDNKPDAPNGQVDPPAEVLPAEAKQLVGTWSYESGRRSQSYVFSGNGTFKSEYTVYAADKEITSKGKGKWSVSGNKIFLNGTKSGTFVDKDSFEMIVADTTWTFTRHN